MELRACLFKSFFMFLLLNLTAYAALAAPSYSVTEISPISTGHDKSIATGINDFGMVVGTSMSRSGALDAVPTHAFLWNSGNITDLGDLPGGDNFSKSAKINNAGWVVGSSGQAGIENSPYSSHPFGRAFVWHDGVMINLGYPEGFVTSNTKAVAINDSGQIVGNVPFLWEAGQMQLLRNPSTNGLIVSANDINNGGQIVGYGNDGGTVRGVIVQGSSVTFVSNPSDIDPGVGLRFRANNNLGQIVGKKWPRKTGQGDE